MSDAAEEMRQQVTEMVASGMTDKEIIEHYRQQYGDRILVVPDGIRAGALCSSRSCIPCFLGILYFLLRRMRRA